MRLLQSTKTRGRELKTEEALSEELKDETVRQLGQTAPGEGVKGAWPPQEKLAPSAGL